MNLQRRRSLCSAFTLIELLVVLAIITLLLALLLPALTRSRDAGRIGVCLSNAAQIGKAHVQYVADHDVIAFHAVTEAGSACAWQYGGKMTSNHWRSPFWLSARGDERPLNPYLATNLDQRDYPVRDDLRHEIPIYRCPSDISSWQRSRYRDPVTMIATYDDVGTSYVFNMTSFGASHGTFGGRTREYQALFERMDRLWASQFIVFWEDSASMGVWLGRNLAGDHLDPSKHTVIMLDGHGEHRVMDTRDDSGPGWRAVEPPRGGLDDPETGDVSRDTRGSARSDQ